MMTDEEFAVQADILNERIVAEVMPIVDKMEEDFPELSGYYALFMTSMHVLFQSGWTADELIDDVEQHYEIHLEDDQGELH